MLDINLSHREYVRHPSVVREVLKLNPLKLIVDLEDNNEDEEDGVSDDEFDPEEAKARSESIDITLSSGSNSPRFDAAATSMGSVAAPVAATISVAANPVVDVHGDKILFKAPCQVILPSTNSSNESVLGILEMTKHRITYTHGTEDFNVDALLTVHNSKMKTESSACKSLWACQQFPSTHWHCSEVWNVAHRYYQLRFVAIEFFTTSRKAFFFNLFDRKTATKFQNILRKVVKPPHMAPFFGKRPSTIIQRATAPGSLLNITVA